MLSRLLCDALRKRGNISAQQSSTQERDMQTACKIDEQGGSTQAREGLGAKWSRGAARKQERDMQTACKIDEQGGSTQEMRAGGQHASKRGTACERGTACKQERGSILYARAKQH
jgi:hypothetical protein